MTGTMGVCGLHFAARVAILTDLMIPDLQSSILCDDVRQERNNKFILIGLFDAIMAQRLPVRYPRLFMVTRWCSGEGEFEQLTRILKPDQNQCVAEGKRIPVRLANPESIATNVEVFLNVAFDEVGTHWVEILLDGDLKVRYPLRVSTVPSGSARGGRVREP
jgi:hypothetical protein